MNTKLAFVTGGSEGIGKEIAKELLKSGISVVIFSRTKAKLEAAIDELRPNKRSTHQKLEFRVLDVTDWKETESVMSDVITEFGTPDFLINCAGYARPGYIDELEIEHYRKMMDLNYFGIVHTCKAVVPFMIEAKRGKIINTSSMAGYIGLFGYTGYCATKWAVVGFSEALRRELEVYGIQVSVLAPPNTATPGLAEENRYKSAEILATEEKAKPVGPEHVAKAVLANLTNNKFMINPTFDGALAYGLSHFAPPILSLFVKRNKSSISKH